MSPSDLTHPLAPTDRNSDAASQAPHPEPYRKESVRYFDEDVCLAGELVKSLRELSLAETLQTTIVLPTKRLATWITAELCPQSQAVVLPKFCNADEAIAAWARLAEPANQGTKLLSPLEIELWLAHHLQTESFRQLRLGHQHEIAQLFGEIDERSRGSNHFDDLDTYLKEDTRIPERGLHILNDRLLELRQLFAAFKRELAQHGYETAAERRRRHTVTILNHYQESLPSNTVFAVGFTSFNESVKPVFRHFLKIPGFELWLNRTSSGLTDLQRLLGGAE